MQISTEKSPSRSAAHLAVLGLLLIGLFAYSQAANCVKPLSSHSICPNPFTEIVHGDLLVNGTDVCIYRNVTVTGNLVHASSNIVFFDTSRFIWPKAPRHKCNFTAVFNPNGIADIMPTFGTLTVLGNYTALPKTSLSVSLDSPGPYITVNGTIFSDHNDFLYEYTSLAVTQCFTQCPWTAPYLERITPCTVTLVQSSRFHDEGDPNDGPFVVRTPTEFYEAPGIPESAICGCSVISASDRAVWSSTEYVRTMQVNVNGARENTTCIKFPTDSPSTKTKQRTEIPVWEIVLICLGMAFAAVLVVIISRKFMSDDSLEYQQI